MQTADKIALAGVIVNSIFSYLVYRATKKSAEVAKQSFEVAELLRK